MTNLENAMTNFYIAGALFLMVISIFLLVAKVER